MRTKLSYKHKYVFKPYYIFFTGKARKSSKKYQTTV